MPAEAWSILGAALAAIAVGGWYVYAGVKGKGWRR